MAKDSMTLADGAERLGRLARILKDNQLGKTGSQPLGEKPQSEAFVLNPEDAWAQKYKSYCIGPACFTAAPPGFIKVPAAPPEVSAGSVAVAAKAAVKPAPAEPIGRAIGKKVRSRSWLGRLIKGR